VGWGVHEERWSLDYTVFMADPSTPSYWEALDEHLQRTFQHPTGATFKIEAACVDSGGHHTQAVYEFCNARTARRIFAIKGIAGPDRPIWPKKATRNVAKKTDVWIVGVDQAKSTMAKRLMVRSQGRLIATFRSWTSTIRRISTASRSRSASRNSSMVARSRFGSARRASATSRGITASTVTRPSRRRPSISPAASGCWSKLQPTGRPIPTPRRRRMCSLAAAACGVTE
jgi:hypothetical protein